MPIKPSFAHQQLLDALLVCHNQEQAIACLSDQQELLGQPLLQLAFQQTLSNATAPAWHLELFLLVGRLVQRQGMFSYLSGQLSDEQLINYLRQHPEVLNAENYQELEDLMHTHVDDEEMQHYLRSCQQQLARAAVLALLLTDDWPLIRPLLRYGQQWLTHSAANEYLQQLRIDSATDAAWSQLLESRTKMLAACGTTSLASAALIRDIDSGWIDKLVEEQSSLAGVEVLRQLLTSTLDVELWALLQHQLGILLSNLAATNREPYQRAGIAAYQQALRIYTQQEYPSEWGYVQYHLGLAYRACHFGDVEQQRVHAIDAYQQALLALTPEVAPHSWAMVLYNLGNAYRARASRQEPADVELAITAYEQALTVLNPESYAADWASVQHNLARSYADRTDGQREANLAQAVALYRQVLLVRTRETGELEWAMTQHNLGSTLLRYESNEYAQHVEEALVALALAIQVRTRTHFPVLWAKTQSLLGDAYIRRVHGEQADNLEEAIRAYHLTLEIYTCEEQAEAWATIKRDLGFAYGARLLGDPAANLLAAIEAHTHTLRYWTRTGHPHDWASQQIILADLYERQAAASTAPASLTEQAICCLEQALEVLSPESGAAELARAQEMLASSYARWTGGEQADNLERALAAIQQAGRIHTREYDAKKWAWNQHLLGSIYQDRLHNEQSDNLEEAIKAYKRALEVFNQAETPDSWAKTQNDLAIAYRNRLRGDTADNIERAIKAYLLVLKVHTRHAYPKYWAMTHMNLSTAYGRRQRGDPAENVELSIAACEQALLIFTRVDYPMEWAQCQLNLSGAYLRRAPDHQADNTALAVVACQRTLEVHTYERHPRYWAFAQNNLGLAYTERLARGITGSFDDAVAAYTAALEYYSHQYDTRNQRGIAANLGSLYYQQQKWAEARHFLEQAESALQRELTETPRHESRQRLARTGNILYGWLVNCCLNMGEPAAASTYAMAGKNRTLTELIAGDSTSLEQLLQQDPGLAAEWLPVQSLQTKLDTLLVQLSADRDAEVSQLTPIAQANAYARVEALHRDIAAHTDGLLFLYPALAAVRPLPLLDAAQAQALAAALGNMHLVEYVYHYGGWGAFVITATAVQYVPLAADLPEQVIDDVNALLNEQFWVQNGWPLDRSTDLRRLYDLLVAPLRPHLVGATLVALAPTSFLHLLPFQALLDEQDAYFGLTYTLSFVPSLTALHVLWEQQTRSNPRATNSRLLSVACSGPARSFLANVLPEAEAVRKFFPATEAEQLLEADALPQRIIDAAKQPFDVVHINCHGCFVYDNPLDSYLLLAGGHEFTVNDIRLRLRLTGRPLVALSACQTGRVRPQREGEASGLAWAFLAAGASAVVASQWAVPDEATRELFEAFYYLRQVTSLPDAEALRQAMRQLSSLEAYHRYPYFWAAFQVTGLPVPV